MLLELGLKSTCPVGTSIIRLQNTRALLLGGVGASVNVCANGSYSRKEIGEPQSPFTNGAHVARTFPLGSRLAGQSLHTIVLPPILGISGPCAQVPVPV